MSETEGARVLRWVYIRGPARMTCELALGDSAVLYEFSVSQGAGSTRSVDRFEHVSRAFQRHSEFEAALIADGWSLETYDSTPLGLNGSRRR
jgi:hypothetical protein